VLLADKVVRTFQFALLWFGNFKTSGCLVGRPTCAPATTTLTLQLVGITTITTTSVPTISQLFHNCWNISLRYCLLCISQRC